MSQDDIVRAWQSLPRRIYLDTSTLQALYDYGGVIWKGDAFPADWPRTSYPLIDEAEPTLRP